jgi:hypothetical protein
VYFKIALILKFILKFIQLISLFNTKKDTNTFVNDNTYNEYHFQKHLNVIQNNGDEHDQDDKKNNSNSFFPPLH